MGGYQVLGPPLRRTPIHVSETKFHPPRMTHASPSRVSDIFSRQASSRRFSARTCCAPARSSTSAASAASPARPVAARSSWSHRMLLVSSSRRTTEPANTYLTMTCFGAAGDGGIKEEGGVPLLPKASLHVLPLFLRHCWALRAARIHLWIWNRKPSLVKIEKTGHFLL
jgi:hypothetical protein